MSERWMNAYDVHGFPTSECGAIGRSGMCKYCDIVTCIFYEEKEEVDSGG